MGKKKMNKLVVDEEKITIDNQQIELVCNNNIHITCFGDNLLVLHNNKDIEIVLEDNSSLKILVLDKAKKDTNITIRQNNNTSIIYKEAFISKDNINVIIDNIVNGNNNKSDIKLRCISKNNNTSIKVFARVLKDTLNNEIIEDIKGINNGGLIQIEPIMKIKTADVVANHFVTIGEIDVNSMFYLQASGVSKKKAQELILSGFLKSIFRDETIDMFGGE